jgi:hypothetical protein
MLQSSDWGVNLKKFKWIAKLLLLQKGTLTVTVHLQLGPRNQLHEFFAYIFCCYNIILWLIKLQQRSQTRGPRATCGPREGPMRSASHFEFETPERHCVSRIQTNKARCLFFSRFWPLLKPVFFYKAAWTVASQKQTIITKFSLIKSVKCSVSMLSFCSTINSWI